MLQAPAEREEILHLRQPLVEQCFDSQIFSSPPQVTRELSVLIQYANRDFLQYLFARCSSKEILDFWLRTGVYFPKDAIALAVTLQSDRVVFQKLQEMGVGVASLTIEDEQEILRRAHGNTKILDYVKEYLAPQKSSVASLC